MVAKVWEPRKADLRHEVKILSERLEEKEQEKIELVRMRSRKELSPEEFEAAKCYEPAGRSPWKSFRDGEILGA